MANFAALIDTLSISGSHLTDGSPNASGVVWFFQPGTNTPVNVYADAEATIIVTAPVTLGAGGLLPSQYSDGIFATQPIRIYIEDASTNVVSDNVWIPASAGDTGVENDGFTDSTLDDVLTAAFTSTGGQDFKYKESGGATERTIKAKFAEIWISVKDFGAVGDGNTIDTSAIQATIDRVKALGGGVVWFPPGTYAVDAVITMTSGTGVALRGAGLSASKIVTSHASANVFTFTTCTSLTVEGLGISASDANSASAISLVGCTRVWLRNLLVNTFGGGTFLIPVIAASNTTTIRMDSCELTAQSADASARALKLSNTSVTAIFGGTYDGKSGAAMEFAGTTSFVSVVGTVFGNSSANIGCLWTAGMTGTDFTVVGCPTLRSAAGTVTTPFDLSALSTNPRFRQWGNEVDGYTADVASGGTATPDLSRGNQIRIRATSTGAAITIAAPTPAPSSLMNGERLYLDIFNNAGGALSNAYTMNAVYHLATVPNQTDLNHNVYCLEWDPNSSVWRQVSLSVTT